MPLVVNWKYLSYAAKFKCVCLQYLFVHVQATLKRMVASERKRRRGKVAPLSDQSVDTPPLHHSRKRLIFMAKIFERITGLCVYL